MVCPCCQGTVREGEEVVVCRACATVHHQACWAAAGGCGSYICAPGRREGNTPLNADLKISWSDLHGAAPLPVAGPRTIPVPPSSPPRTSRLAIASLICAVAGIPFFGLITGMVAVLLGSLALGSIRGTRNRGVVLSVLGILLGMADVVGWLVFLSFYLGHPAPVFTGREFHFDREALEGLDPKIGRAMRANVLIQGRRLLGGTLGSGVILTLGGGKALILTNRHVVDPNFSAELPAGGEGRAGDTPLDVTLVDQNVRSGRVVWLAPAGIDLALVEITRPTDEARAARWDPGRRPPRVGESVFAIGNPLGLGWTHTQGAVSQLRVHETGGRRVPVIQTQAVLNAGNSGGGLYDSDGYLVGINTWAEDKRVSEGLGFAISLETLKSLRPPGLDLDAGGKEGKQP